MFLFYIFLIHIFLIYIFIYMFFIYSTLIITYCNITHSFNCMSTPRSQDSLTWSHHRHSQHVSSSEKDAQLLQWKQPRSVFLPLSGKRISSATNYPCMLNSHSLSQNHRPGATGDAQEALALLGSAPPAHPCLVPHRWSVALSSY